MEVFCLTPGQHISPCVFPLRQTSPRYSPCSPLPRATSSSSSPHGLPAVFGGEVEEVVLLDGELRELVFEVLAEQLLRDGLVVVPREVVNAI